MGKSYLPDKDPALLAWSLNFTTRINLAPLPLGLSIPLATGYQDLHDAFATAMQAVEPGVRNKSSVALKNACRAALKDNARLLASIINGQASVSDATKLDLGLTVRATPSPIPAPSIAPKIDIVSMIGNALTVRLHDGTGSRRGRPPLVQGCSIFSFVGATPPNTVEAWRFEGSSSEMLAKIVFDPALAPGTKVWVTGFFCNAKLESGPAADPVGTQIQFSPLNEAV